MKHYLQQENRHVDLEYQLYLGDDFDLMELEEYILAISQIRRNLLAKYPEDQYDILYDINLGYSGAEPRLLVIKTS